jgi:hypothetical protein
MMILAVLGNKPKHMVMGILPIFLWKNIVIYINMAFWITKGR